MVSHANWQDPHRYVRWKYSANMSSAEPGVKGTLMLESLVLPESSELESLPHNKRQVLTREPA